MPDALGLAAILTVIAVALVVIDSVRLRRRKGKPPKQWWGQR